MRSKDSDERGDEPEDAPQEESASNPIVCGRNSKDHYIFGHLLPVKGDSEDSASILAFELTAGGYPRQVVRSDGEPALVALAVAAMKIAKIRDGVELVREQTLKADSKGNGLAEGAVKEIKAKVRTLRFFVKKASEG